MLKFTSKAFWAWTSLCGKVEIIISDCVIYPFLPRVALGICIFLGIPTFHLRYLLSYLSVHVLLLKILLISVRLVVIFHFISVFFFSWMFYCEGLSILLVYFEEWILCFIDFSLSFFSFLFHWFSFWALLFLLTYFLWFILSFLAFWDD